MSNSTPTTGPRIDAGITTTAPPPAIADAQREIRVLLADDHPMVRLGVRNLIDHQPDMGVVAEARSAEEAVASLGQDHGVAILDYHLGSKRDGLWVTRQLKQGPRAPRILIYSAFTDSALAAAAIVAGADGLLSKASLGEELCDAVRELARGGQYLPEVPRPVEQAMCSQLRPDDQPIFGMLLAGLDPAEISRALELAPGELSERRGSMLHALAPAANAAPDGSLPLDYERARRRPRYKAA